MLLALLRNELRLIINKPADIFQPILFGLITLTLFVLAIGPKAALLMEIAAPIIWVIVLLAILLASDRLFYDDMQDGILEQEQLSGRSFILIIAIKLLAHWIFIVMPLILICPLYAKMLFLPEELVSPLMISLLLGTPSLTLFSALGSALTLSIRRGSLLLGLIITPLNIPVLIFAVSALEAAQMNLAYTGQLALLGAALLLSGLLCLPAISAALKLNG